MKKENELNANNQQIDRLHQTLKNNTGLYQIIQEVAKLNLPNYYVGGGAITQTFWNYLYGNPPEYGISDVDIVYFDEDLSEEKETKIIQEIKTMFQNSIYQVDVANEARVHLWYEKAFGKKITPYTSTEHAISTWPSTATSIGVKLCDGELRVFAPFRLDDLFDGVIRANKVLIDKDIYEAKVDKWSGKWPELQVVEW